MSEKIVELKYSLTKEHAEKAYELSGEKKARIEKNRNTTICFAVIILLFGFNIVTTLTKESDMPINKNYMLYTSIAFIVISLIMIAITWLGGNSVIKNNIKAVSDGTEYQVFINENGISYIFGNEEEKVLSRGDFAIKSSADIYLLTAGEKKLIIPKEAIAPEDVDLVRLYLL